MTSTQKPASAARSALVRRSRALLAAGGLALGLVLAGAGAASADAPPPPYISEQLGDLAPPQDLQEGNWNSTGS
ncbi:hypothetical protein [Streptomyces sp. NBC_01565]|uniref:hypothetical protein n=1 Tax=unclassified Streptomyces TaxID=2593676 RepID=UPI00225699FA|nr:hypothetical protein [Streptomyces sp. NBC_01565]MCX4543092.1 hypothetical protein [Streptomyces sp. NBC_01565]